MARSVDNYGNEVIYKLLAADILYKSALSEMDVEIFVLRYGHDWYYEDIGAYIGNKYRDKPYTEGAIRYRTRLIRNTLKDFLSKVDEVDDDLR